MAKVPIHSQLKIIFGVQRFIGRFYDQAYAWRDCIFQYVKDYKKKTQNYKTLMKAKYQHTWKGII